MKFIDELGMPVWWTTEARRRCQWEAQETTREEKMKRVEPAGDASAADEVCKAARKRSR